MKNKIVQSGRSMVEMMGYMAVVLSVTAGIGALISNTYDEYKYSKASLQISEFASAVVRASAVDPDYGEIIDNIKAMNDKGKVFIPKSYRVVGSKIYHAFGGTVDVGWPPASTSGEDKTKFAIKFNKLKRKQCIELAMKDWQNNRSVDLFEIQINNNTPWYWSVYSGSMENTLPVKRSVVAGTGTSEGQCAEEKDNSITWIFN